MKALRILRVVMRTQLTVEKHWFVFNFNDVVMAFATWFTQLLLQYSPGLAEALQSTNSWGSVA